MQTLLKFISTNDQISDCWMVRPFQMHAQLVNLSKWRLTKNMFFSQMQFLFLPDILKLHASAQTFENQNDVEKTYLMCTFDFIWI